MSWNCPSAGPDGHLRLDPETDVPVYEYKCPDCEQHFDIEQSFTDDALTTLEGCEVNGDGMHRLKKVFSAVGISFKGDGFYRNDARSGSSSSSSSSSDSSSSNGSSSSDSSSTSDSSSKSESKSQSSTSSSGSGSASSSSSSSKAAS